MMFTLAHIPKPKGLRCMSKRKASTRPTSLYMADDIPDLGVMKMVGLPVCPADACEEIKAVSTFVSPYGGGKGCARDIIEKVMKVQGKWMNAEAYSW
jgi:3-deoxy-D-manno-octulosonate 8-phosphate phosphatase (KDO 8-P phosphatase)